MRIVHCILALLTLLGSYNYHVIILVDKVLLHSIDVPIAEKVMYSNFCIVYSIFQIVFLSFFAGPTLNKNWLNNRNIPLKSISLYSSV